MSQNRAETALFRQPNAGRRGPGAPGGHRAGFARAEGGGGAVEGGTRSSKQPQTSKIGLIGPNTSTNGPRPVLRGGRKRNAPEPLGYRPVIRPTGSIRGVLRSSTALLRASKKPYTSNIPVISMPQAVVCIAESNAVPNELVRLHLEGSRP